MLPTHIYYLLTLQLQATLADQHLWDSHTGCNRGNRPVLKSLCVSFETEFQGPSKGPSELFVAIEATTEYKAGINVINVNVCTAAQLSEVINIWPLY